jgi:hypothetical protein
MKKLAVSLCLSAIAVGAFAQGTVNFVNTSTTNFRINATGLGGGVSNAPPIAGGFYFGVFTASSTITSATAYDLLTPNWTFTGLYGTNTVATAGGRMSGGNGAGTQTGWQPGQTNSFLVAGWSADLGHDWSVVASQLQGTSYSGGVWRNWSKTGGFFGISAVGFGAAGGGPTGIPAFGLFGAPNLQGNPIGSPTDLFITQQIPEPTAFALAGLGAAALVIFRRRKA